MVEYDVILPDMKPRETEEEIGKIRKVFFNDKTLSKILIFLYKIQPSSVTELADFLSTYFRRDYDRGSVYFDLKRLKRMGMVNLECIHDVQHSNNKSKIHRKIISKYSMFLQKIPKNFQKRFDKVNYFYLTSFGKEMIPHIAKILGFKVNIIEEKKADISK